MAVSLSNIVDVTVQVVNPVTISSSFNLALIIGDTAVLTSDDRVKVYYKSNYATEMVSDGFQATDPEYVAVTKYFAQNNAPDKVAVGVKLSGDTTVKAAVDACRSFNTEWYAFAFAEEQTDSDIAAVAAAVEAYDNPTVYFYASNAANALVSGTTNIFNTLKIAGYTRSIGIFSNESYADVAFMGVFCSFNTLANNSAYTMAYKSIAGITAEELTDAQLAILKGYNGNAYCKFGRNYSFIVQAVVANGNYVDEIYLYDVAKNLIQQHVIEGLTSARVIPQTESGISTIISFINNACEKLRSIGFIETGVWNGPQVGSLKAGDAVTGGYYIESDPISSQSAAERASRVTPPIYVALKSAGAIEHVVITAYIDR